MKKEEFVILVDSKDNSLGKMEKMEAHRSGNLHRAFSVFVYNDIGEMMLQRRAFSKYHSPGLWTNACCSHPKPEESTIDAAHRRLMEEMGFDCKLEEIFSFIYKAEVGNELTEHEFDHVFTGKWNKPPELNSEEADDWKFMPIDAIRKDMIQNPSNYTVWFRIAFAEIENYLTQKNRK